MPVHDWTLVEASIFHDFHLVWISALQSVLNQDRLPEGYYALVEQHVGRSLADVLTLHASPVTGGIAVAEMPPRIRRTYTVEWAALARRRSLAIRHVSGHRLIALVEIVSWPTKIACVTSKTSLPRSWTRSMWASMSCSWTCYLLVRTIRRECTGRFISVWSKWISRMICRRRNR